MSTDKALEEAAKEYIALGEKCDCQIVPSDIYKAGAYYREQNPRWKYPEVDGWPTVGDVVAIELLPERSGCANQVWKWQGFKWKGFDFPSSVEQQIELTGIKRWLLIEGGK